MSCTFLHCRVSTAGQFTTNHVQEVKVAGFDVQASRVVEETISAALPPANAPAFRNRWIVWNQGMC